MQVNLTLCLSEYTRMQYYLLQNGYNVTEFINRVLLWNSRCTSVQCKRFYCNNKRRPAYGSGYKWIVCMLILTKS